MVALSEAPPAPVVNSPETVESSQPKPLLKPISGGVLNGKALSLPSPAYPDLAKRMRTTGTVTVEVVLEPAVPRHRDGQVPGGELLDIVRAKRALTATCVVTLALSALILRLWPSFPLVALAQALKLPDGAALTLFALGRTIGWIGHAMEQYARDEMIRPRAKYVGVMP